MLLLNGILLKKLHYVPNLVNHIAALAKLYQTMNRMSIEKEKKKNEREEKSGTT